MSKQILIELVGENETGYTFASTSRAFMPLSSVSHGN